MIEIKTENASATVFKTKQGLELQQWRIKNHLPPSRLALKSPHFHDEWQIGFVTQGIIENRYRKNREIVPPRKLYIIQPGEIHSENLVQERTLRFCFAFIAQQRIDRAVEEMTDGRRPPVDFNELFVANTLLNNQLVEQTALFFSTLQHNSSDLERETHFLDWITAVLASRSAGELTVRKLGHERRAINAVKAHLSDSFAQATSLDRLSEVACLSKFHLLRSFVKETGMTIHQYQTQLKICKAKELLKDGKRVVDVALELGFFDQAHFSKCFKRFTSQTPGQFQ